MLLYQVMRVSRGVTCSVTWCHVTTTRPHVIIYVTCLLQLSLSSARHYNYSVCSVVHFEASYFTSCMVFAKLFFPLKLHLSLKLVIIFSLSNFIRFSHLTSWQSFVICVCRILVISNFRQVSSNLPYEDQFPLNCLSFDGLYL